MNDLRLERRRDEHVNCIHLKTDPQLKTDVESELKWEPRVDANEIGVVVKDGVVSLTGWVDLYIKRFSAEDATHRVRGVKAVANEIAVRLAPEAERNDADIAAAAVRTISGTRSSTSTTSISRWPKAGSH